MKHLTDSEIQDYQDGNMAERNAEIEIHLQDCRLCRDKLRQYEILYNSLRIDNIPEMSAKFSESVMSAITSGSFQTAKFKYWQVIYAIFGSIIGLGLIYYFLDIKLLFNSFRVLNIGQNADLTFLTGFKDFLAGFGIDLTLIISAGLILIFIFIFDYLIKFARRKMVSFVL